MQAFKSNDQSVMNIISFVWSFSGGWGGEREKEREREREREREYMTRKNYLP